MHFLRDLTKAQLVEAFQPLLNNFVGTLIVGARSLER